MWSFSGMRMTQQWHNSEMIEGEKSSTPVHAGCLEVGKFAGAGRLETIYTSDMIHHFETDLTSLTYMRQMTWPIRPIMVELKKLEPTRWSHMIICPLRHGIISTVAVKISSKCRLRVCVFSQDISFCLINKCRMCDNKSKKELVKKVGNILPRLYMLFSSFSFALNPGTR